MAPHIDELRRAGRLAALLFGGALGWQRGRTVQIYQDGEDGTIKQMPSRTTLMIIVAVALAKLSLGAGTSQEDGRATAALLLFVFALVSTQRLENYLRARALLVRAP